MKVFIYKAIFCNQGLPYVRNLLFLKNCDQKHLKHKDENTLAL